MSNGRGGRGWRNELHSPKYLQNPPPDLPYKHIQIDNQNSFSILSVEHEHNPILSSMKKCEDKLVDNSKKSFSKIPLNQYEKIGAPKKTDHQSSYMEGFTAVFRKKHNKENI